MLLMRLMLNLQFAYCREGLLPERPARSRALFGRTLHGEGFSRHAAVSRESLPSAKGRRLHGHSAHFIEFILSISNSGLLFVITLLIRLIILKKPVGP